MNRSNSLEKVRLSLPGVFRGVWSGAFKADAAYASSMVTNQMAWEPLSLPAPAFSKSRSNSSWRTFPLRKAIEFRPKSSSFAPISRPTNCSFARKPKTGSWTVFMREGRVESSPPARLSADRRHRPSSSPPIWVCGGLRVRPPRKRGGETMGPENRFEPLRARPGARQSAKHEGTEHHVGKWDLDATGPIESSRARSFFQNPSISSDSVQNTGSRVRS